MADKGGNGFSIGKGVSFNGSFDDSTGLKKGRKVQFSNQVNQEFPANISSYSGGNLQGDPDKVGKGGKGVNGGKSSGRKESAKYVLNIQSELPKNSRCVMDCEAADILQGIQEQMTFLSRDPTIKLPVSFDKGLQYAKNGARYSNPKTVRKVLATLKKHGVSDAEICIIANTCPETAEEVFALVPSLKTKKSNLTGPLENIIAKLVKLKLPAETFKD
ncbi:unnamed protein product [Amaranthus hypochondriacus]